MNKVFFIAILLCTVCTCTDSDSVLDQEASLLSEKQLELDELRVLQKKYIKIFNHIPEPYDTRIEFARSVKKVVGNRNLDNISENKARLLALKSLVTVVKGKLTKGYKFVFIEMPFFTGTNANNSTNQLCSLKNLLCCSHLLFKT